ncbi:MAG: YoaK family protein [Fusobacteriaceae bacterium]
MLKKFQRNTLGFIVALCFLGGMVNTTAIVLYADTVSHFTGRALKIFMELSKYHTAGLLKSMEIMVLFLLGNATSGYILANEKREHNRNLMCGTIIVILGISLVVLYYFFFNRSFFLFILPMLVGIQNGMLIKYKGIAAKTTHITGIFTDIGVYIGRYLRGDKKEIWKIEFSLFTMLGFLFGGFFAIKIYSILEGDIFYLIGFLYILLGIVFLDSNRKRIKEEKGVHPNE